MAVVDLAEKLSLFSEHWSPKVIARLNDYEIKLVKLKGEFVWHSHEDTDELFLVIDGSLTIQLRDGDVTLGPGQLYVVPRGVEHCPIAEGDVSVMLIEPEGVVNTGGVVRRAHRQLRRQPARLLATPGARSALDRGLEAVEHALPVRAELLGLLLALVAVLGQLEVGAVARRR